MIVGVTLIILCFIFAITSYNIIDSNNTRKKYEAAARVDIARLEYNRMMGIMEVPEPDVTELREKHQEEQMNDYDIVTCPKCDGEQNLPNYNNTDWEECDRCDGSGELRWDHFEPEEKRKYLAG